MIKRFMINLSDAVMSVFPVMIVMLVIGGFLRFNTVTMISILISTLLLIIGVSLFTYGADISMIEIGKTVSSGLLKSRKVFIIALVSFIVGVVITIAEPDLKVLASQMTAINSSTLILSVGIGVGIFLSIAALRIIYQIKLKIIIGVCYTVLLLMLLISSKEMIPLAFDSGGVTTGPMTVPFILAMGIGFSASRTRKKSQNDSFGLVSLCSIGPIMTVLILGLLIKSDMTYTYNIDPEVTSLVEVFSNYFKTVIPLLEEVIVSLLPIVVLFILFVLITKNVKKRQFIKVMIGLVITLIGLTLFFTGVNVGYMPIAYLIGMNMYSKSKVLLVILGIVIGFVIVKAEPAVAVLTEQIEKITQGSIKRSVMNNTIAIGVAVAVGISIIRVLTRISLIGFLVAGYIIALVLMCFSPDIFTMVAFDSGGAVTGPMTTTFLLPLIIGICYASGGNVLTDAFGLVALVAMSPLLTIQSLGIIYKIKSSKVKALEDIDETIIEFKRSGSVG